MYRTTRVEYILDTKITKEKGSRTKMFFEDYFTKWNSRGLESCRNRSHRWALIKNSQQAHLTKLLERGNAIIEVQNNAETNRKTQLKRPIFALTQPLSPLEPRLAPFEPLYLSSLTAELIPR